MRRVDGLASFMTKVSYGSHRANGLELLDEYFEKRLRRKY